MVIASLSAPRSAIAPCPAKILSRRLWRDHRAGYACGAVDRKWRTERIDGGRNVNRRRKSALAAAFVVGAVDRINFGQAKTGKACKHAGRHPFAAGINLPRACGNGNAAACRDHIAIANDNSAAINRRGAIADDNLPPVIAIVSA